jgi:hypothetical protein
LDANLFIINATTGAVSFKSPPNFEAPQDFGADNTYNFTVRGFDGTRYSDAQEVAVKVSNVGDAAGDAVLDLGSDGKLINPVQVDGGKWYYYWDRNADGKSASADTVSHDTLDGIFNRDIHGELGAGGNTNDTYRYASLNGFQLALPTLGTSTALPATQNYVALYGTTIGNGSNASNATYDDLTAVWDAQNGTGTQANVSGTPAGWADGYYWTATASNSGHALFGLKDGHAWNYPDPNNYYVAIQVL